MSAPEEKLESIHAYVKDKGYNPNPSELLAKLTELYREEVSLDGKVVPSWEERLHYGFLVGFTVCMKGWNEQTKEQYEWLDKLAEKERQEIKDHRKKLEDWSARWGTGRLELGSSSRE